jgi:hypothetical protein
MAIIFSYPVVIPTADDYVLGTDVTAADKPTKNFTVQSIIDLVTVATGNLQTVLDLGNTAIGKDIDLTNNTFRGDGLITVGGASITGQVGVGFTDFTSTRITGTLQTAAQPNITSLGNLTALVVNGAISGTSVITSTTLVGASNTNIASTLAIKTYVDNQVGLYDTLAEVLANGNTTGATKIEVDNTGGGIDFIDDAKLRLGTGDDFEMYHANADNNTYLKEAGAGSLELWASTTTLKNAAGAETFITATDGGSVDLYYNNVKAFETTATGSQVPTGVLTIPVGSEAAPSLTFASDPNTGIYRAAADRVGITAGGVLGLTVDATDTVIEGNFTCSADFISQSTTTATFGGKVSGSDPTANIEFATKGYVDTLVGGKTLEYAGDATGPFALNLNTDDLEFNGDSNITVTAAAVAATKGIVTIDLNNSVTITGTSKAGTFTTTAGTASWTTTVMTGFTSITSTSFIGALTGNASTATALASAGAITLTGDTTSTGGPYTYTSGGALSISTTIADTTVTGKVLTNLPTPTSSAIAATDTILAAMGKLQGQITGIPQGLVYKGTWNASTNTPTLASGTGTTGEFYIVSVAGATNLDGITDWLVGDWAIFVEVGVTDTWQKIDNTSDVTGTGAANKIAKWTAPTVLATGLIEDDGTDVTIGNSGNLIVEGDSTLGASASDSTLVKGQLDVEENFIAREGIGLGLAPAYGSSGQVLTSGGNSSTACTWTTPTTGTVTSVALTETGDALTITGSPITSSGTLNIAGAGASTDYINGELDLVAFPTLDNYVSWTLAGDTGSSQTISSTNTATFAGGFGISTVASATDTLTTAIDIVGTDNAIAGLTAATPLATDTLWFNDISDSNTIRKATIADIVDLGNETLAQVLGNGNTSGANDIVMADSQKVTFGTAPDLQLYHDTNNSYIETTSGSAGDLFIRAQGSGHDLYLRATDDIFIQPQGSENGIKVIGDGGVELYYDNSKKFETTSAGVTVTGSATATSASDDGFIVNSTDNASLRGLVIQSSGVDRAGMQLLPNTGEIKIGGYFGTNDEYPVIYSDGVASLTFGIGATPTATFANNVEIDGNLTVDGQIIHGGTHGGGGTYYKEYTTGTVAAGAATAFTLTRATSGTLMFSVYLTATLATNKQVAKMYQVAHTYGQTPVYNKIIDTGPLGADITVAFADSSNTAVICSIAAVTEDSQPVGITVIVGHGATAVTFA